MGGKTGIDLCGSRGAAAQRKSPVSGETGLLSQRQNSVLRGRRCVRWPVAPVGHELIELGLVLGHPQAVEEIAELALFLLEPAQRFAAVVVEGTVAAGRIPRCALITSGLTSPVETPEMSATHSSAPYGEGESGET